VSEKRRNKKNKETETEANIVVSSSFRTNDTKIEISRSVIGGVLCGFLVSGNSRFETAGQLQTSTQILKETKGKYDKERVDKREEGRREKKRRSYGQNNSDLFRAATRRTVLNGQLVFAKSLLKQTSVLVDRSDLNVCFVVGGIQLDDFFEGIHSYRQEKGGEKEEGKSEGIERQSWRNRREEKPTFDIFAQCSIASTKRKTTFNIFWRCC
jgi:hypothetical protein